MEDDGPRKSAEDLGGIGMQIEDWWRKYRPKFVAAFEADGTLYDHLVEAEERVLELSDQLWKSGMNAMEAEQYAMYEFVYLPDLEEV